MNHAHLQSINVFYLTQSITIRVDNIIKDIGITKIRINARGLYRTYNYTNERL